LRERLLADSIQKLLSKKEFEMEAVYNGKTGEAYAELRIYDPFDSENPGWRIVFQDCTPESITI